jgi:hypothetical protein
MKETENFGGSFNRESLQVVVRIVDSCWKSIQDNTCSPVSNSKVDSDSYVESQ